MFKIILSYYSFKLYHSILLFILYKNVFLHRRAYKNKNKTNYSEKTVIFDKKNSNLSKKK